MATNAFELTFFQGDTVTMPVKVARLGTSIDFTGYTVKLFIETQDEATVEIAGVQDSESVDQMNFTITKAISEALALGAHRCWIEINSTSPETHITFMGLLTIEAGRTEEDV